MKKEIDYEKIWNECEEEYINKYAPICRYDLIEFFSRNRDDIFSMSTKGLKISSEARLKQVFKNAIELSRTMWCSGYDVCYDDLRGKLDWGW